jgi:hypothetical protein
MDLRAPGQHRQWIPRIFAATKPAPLDWSRDLPPALPMRTSKLKQVQYLLLAALLGGLVIPLLTARLVVKSVPPRPEPYDATLGAFDLRR